MCRSLLLLLLFASIDTLAVPAADVVLKHGAVYTVDGSRSWADAVVITGDKISYVGLDVEASKYIGDKTKVVDLKGKMVLPGFQDSHIHPVSSALNSYMCSLFGLPSVEGYLEKIKSCVTKYPDAKWIHGAGWAHRIFEGGKFPDKKILDSITNEIPLTLNSYDGHSLWANSKALEVAGVDSTTQDVTSGKIIRYESSNEPTGIFLEDPAADLVMRAKPDYTDAEVYDALQYVQSYLNGLGITSVQDALLRIGGEGGIYDVIRTYQQAAKDDALTMRVVGALYWDPNKGMEQVERMKSFRDQYSYGLFQATSVKIWQDGVMHTHTSRLLEDYSDMPGEKGMSMIAEERLSELVVALDKEGFQMHFHADGDGALRQCLNAVEKARSINGVNDNRHNIAHLELVHPDDIPRFRDLDVIANVQPMWSTSRAYIGDLINVKLGEKRKRWLEINQSFIDAGVTVAYGSDWYVTTPNPVELIEAAVTRIRPAIPLEEKRTLKPLLPEENVSLADAIASYTINGAYLNHQEKTTGSIEVGKFADIVVLDKNLFDVPSLEISDTKVEMTFVAGKLVYSR